MQIVVKTLTGETFALDVEACWTIARVKARIRDKTHIPPDQQRLNYPWQWFDNLKDDRMLSDYNIQQETSPRP